MSGGAPSARLHLAPLTSLAALETLGAPLADLVAASGASVFHHPAFFLPWARAATANGQRPACLALYRGTDLCGLLPYFVKRDAHRLFGRVLGPPRYGSSPCFDLLLAGVDEDAAVAMFGAAMQRMGWLRQDIRFDTEGSRIGGVWADWFAQRGHRVTRVAGPDYCVSRNTGSAEQFRAGLDGRQRREAERKLRKLNRVGGITLVEQDAPLGPVLAQMQAIVAASWKGSAEMRHRGWDMLRAVTLSMADAGLLRLWFAHAEGIPVAYLMEFRDHTGNRHAFHNAQAESADPFSPGVSILYHAVAAAHDEGAPVYEFWGGRPYLRRFANGTRATGSVLIENARFPHSARATLGRMVGWGRRRDPKQPDPV